MTGTDLPPVAVIGLGFAGLALAVDFGRTQPVISFDLGVRLPEALAARIRVWCAASNAALAGQLQTVLAARWY